MTETYRKAIISKNKTLLLYGPKGCGKSLTAMAIANHIKAKFIQIDDPKFFIEDNKFAFELSNLSVARQPIIVYLKYIDAMYPALKFIYFFLDKIINGKTDNKILIIVARTHVIITAIILKSEILGNDPKNKYPRIVPNIDNNINFIVVIPK